MIDVGFYAPRWAGGPRSPDPEELAAFAKSLAERYPQVRLWTVWNEPNHPEFLQPQWSDGVPVAAHRYRRMHELAYEEIKRASEDNRVLIGGLTSIGSPRRGPRDAIRPLRFLREMACVDARLRPLERPECDGLRAAEGRRLRHPPLHAQAAAHPAAARPRQRRHGRPGPALPAAAGPGRPRPHRGPAGRVRDRVRLRDRTARPPPRRLAPAPGGLPAGRGGRGAGPARRAHARPVPAARPRRRRPLPDRAPAAERSAQGGAVLVPGVLRGAPWHRAGPGPSRPRRSLRVRRAPGRPRPVGPDGLPGHRRRRRGAPPGHRPGHWRLRWDQPGRRPLYSLPTPGAARRRASRCSCRTPAGATR